MGEKRKRSTRRLTLREQYEVRRLLYDDDQVPGVTYNPDFHPGDLLQFFRERYESVEDPVRYATEHKLDFIMPKVRLPTLAGYAAKIGVRRETLWAWAKQYEAFDEAVGICKAMQEAMFVELTALGAIDSRFGALFMKNKHEWQDKVETVHKGGLTLHFDEQDREA